MNESELDTLRRGADDDVARFILGRVAPDLQGCWNWVTPGRRYPAITGHGLAHRVSYSLWVGDLVPGLEIDHVCYNARCVNPEHLEQVPAFVNRRRQRPKFYRQHTPMASIRRVERAA